MITTEPKLSMLDLKLIPETDPRLHTPVNQFSFTSQPTGYTEQLVEDLLKTMKAFEGIGLSANQVGLDVRVFVMAVNEEVGCFNPEIIGPSAEDSSIQFSSEGCLSFPGLELTISRQQAIDVTYLTHAGERINRTLRGLEAICFQHELDHLNGITFTQRVSRLQLERARNKARKESRRSHGFS